MASNEQCGEKAGIQLYWPHLNNQLVIMTRWYSSHPQWELQSRCSYQAVYECGQLADGQTPQWTSGPCATHNAGGMLPSFSQSRQKPRRSRTERYWTCVEAEIRAELELAQSVCFSVNFTTRGNVWRPQRNIPSLGYQNNINNPWENSQ